jgi:hypothetical protein
LAEFVGQETMNGCWCLAGKKMMASVFLRKNSDRGDLHKIPIYARWLEGNGKACPEIEHALLA